jgi:hypothetical protein
MGIDKNVDFIEKLREIILSIPEDAEVPDDINEYFIGKMKEFGVEIPEDAEIPNMEKFLFEKFKELGFKIPDGIQPPQELEMPYLNQIFWGLSKKIQDEITEYLGNLDIKSFGYNQELNEDEKARWWNIYILSKEYYLDSLIESSKEYRENTKLGGIKFPISGRNVMDGPVVDFFHYKHLEKYLNGIGWDILGMFFSPKHKIITRQSGDKINYYVYIRPSRLTDEIILSCDEGKLQVLSKEKISKETIEKYLLYCEENIENVIGEERIKKYLK